jgi:hypothetical protein
MGAPKDAELYGHRPHTVIATPAASGRVLELRNAHHPPSDHSGYPQANNTFTLIYGLGGDHLTLSAIAKAPDGVETINTLVWKWAPNPSQS